MTVSTLTVGLNAARSNTSSIIGAPPMAVDVIYFFAGFALFLTMGDVIVILPG
jgi:hypothetical protein